IDDRNCSSLDSIFIRVKKSGNVFAPNVFSPNGDNINDYFYIQGFDQAIVEILFIYDRWGNKVFEAKNVPVNIPTAGWNGKFHGDQMNPAVYIYYAKIRIQDGDAVELFGDVNLIK
ncbi:MAG: gliding motility-associated C-terminal domain-containing protein, partial [Saprospiraceae bacterium]